MDIHFTNAEPSAEERAAVDAFLGHPDSTWHGGERRPDIDGHVALRDNTAQRHQLLPALHAVSDRIGWISEGALNYVCRRLSIAPADAYGVASFYGLFSTTQRTPLVVHVCDDIACMAAGADRLCRDLEQTVGPPGAAAPGAASTWLRSPCLGLCDRAPAALAIRAGAEHRDDELAPTSAAQISSVLRPANAGPTSGSIAEPATPVPQELAEPAVRVPLQHELRLLRRIGRIDPASLDEYKATGGYSALRRALEFEPTDIIREVVESKLVGRGGAAFPTGRKWEAVAREPDRPHYLVCNADESEPGTFKDRILMEGDPFALVEAMTIAAYAGGCERGFIYIRGEYAKAARTLSNAIERARSHGLLGNDIFGRGFRFDIEIRRGAGAYICGEETALFNSIEGRRGEPRNKPPFPTQKGLFGKPTIVNNVETFVNVLDIVLEGGRAFASIGTSESTGTKLFCLTGHVREPGLYEIPFGATLRQLIELAGGVRGGKRIGAVLLGGAAGTFLSPEEIDMPLSFEATRRSRASLGSGVVMVFDEDADLWPFLLRIAAFFRDESCGQCVPCRVGTVRQEELLHRLAARKPLGSVEVERALMGEIGQVMRDASICGLGQTASSAIESAMQKFKLWERSASA